MIDDDVIQVFKASLTHLMVTKMKATGFVFESITLDGGMGKVHGFLIRDDHVASHIKDLLDELSKDSGGRQQFDVENPGKEGS